MTTCAYTARYIHPLLLAYLFLCIHVCVEIENDQYLFWSPTIITSSHQPLWDLPATYIFLYCHPSPLFWYRQGNGEAAAKELAAACSRPLREQHGIKPTQLFARNAEVDAVNAKASSFETDMHVLGYLY